MKLKLVMKSEVLLIFLLAVGVALAYFDIQIQRVQQLSDRIYFDYSTLKVRKKNGTRTIIGNVTFNQPIDNTFRMEVLAYIKQGGEYRILPYKLVKPYCDFYKEDNFGVYEEACEYSDFVFPSPCPFEVGTYGFHNYYPSFENIPRMILHTGDYALELSVYDKRNKQVFRGRAFGAIINY